MEQRAQALTSAEIRTIRFEQLSDWERYSGTGTLSSSTHRSEGEKSLALDGMGYIAVRNLTPLTKDDRQTPEVVGFDLWIPPNPPNPGWHGDAQLSVDAPSAGVWSQYLGYRSLQNLPKGQWVHVEFPVPNWIRQQLDGANYTDLRFIIAVNVTPGSATHYVDHFTLGPVSSECTPVSDGNACTADECNPANGQTTHVPVAPGTPCSDQNACNGVEACNGAGSCEPGTPPVLDDGNVCTTDGCDPASGVTHTPVAVGTNCDNGDVCDGVATCSAAGSCAPGSPPAVDDGNPCTVDACDPSGGVTNTPVSAGTSCDNGNVCDGISACNAVGSCLAGTAPVVDDSNPCTADACDPSGGVTHTPVTAGTACDDGNVCNGVSACNAGGSCIAGAPPAVDDGNPCTTDSCNPATGIQNIPVPLGVSCADANACNGAEACDGSGACQAGVPPSTEDGNPCTVGSCNPATGAITQAPAPNGTACSDGDACTTGDVCEVGVCGGGQSVVCGGAGDCTAAGACNPATGACEYAQLPDGTACSDGSSCTAGDSCQAGTCVPGEEASVEEQPCRVATCDEVSGGVVFELAPEGTACPIDACTTGACSADGECLGAPLPADTDACTLEVCDPATGVTTYTCPPIDPTVATSTFDATSWLYSGPNPYQRGVAPGTIEAARAALVRGLVTSRDGTPLGGALVTVHGHPEYGEVLTQLDGRFDLVVNGGGPLVLDYHKAGLLDSSRRVNPRWNSTVEAETVVLIASDPVVTAVELDAESTDYQVAVSSVVSDDDGERQATLLFPPGVQAVMEHADGSLELLASMHVRITEFTVGDSGPEAMPATLPTNTGYTYAFEVNADEAVAQGAPEIEFSEPLVYYVENFLGFPAGEPVPIGAYDREVGAWVPHDSGVVIDIVSTAGGIASVDVTGDGVADSAAVLGARGITTGELQALSSLYAPGASLWRVRLPHFTQPYDCNWPFHYPDDADDPDDTGGPNGGGDDDPAPDGMCNASTIELQNQVYGEQVSVAGSPLTLHYSSARAEGFSAARTLEIPLTLPDMSPSLRGVRLTVDVAGQHYEQDFTPEPGAVAHFTWDGLDGFGRAVQGRQNAKVTIRYAYQGVYGRAARFNDPSQGHFPAGLSGDRTRQELFITRTWQLGIGNWQASDAGLGGWSLSEHHSYVPSSGELIRGDGTIDEAPSTLAWSIERVATDAAGAGAVATGPDGSLYYCGNDPSIQNSAHAIVRRRAPDGTVTTVAGTGVRGYSGDGGPATSAMINCYGGALAVGADGSVYVAAGTGPETGVAPTTVRRLTPDGTIHLYAGVVPGVTPQAPGYAVGTGLSNVRDLVESPNGGLFVVAGSAVWKVELDGRLQRVTVPGSVPWTQAPEGHVSQRTLDAFAVDVHPQTGELHILSGATGTPGGFYRIYALGTDGQLRLLAGCVQDQPCSSTAGLDSAVPALQLRLYGGNPLVRFSRDGTLHFSGLVGAFVTEGNTFNGQERAWRLDPDGLLRTPFGEGLPVATYPVANGRPLSRASVGAYAFAFRDDGVFVQGGNVIYLGRPPLPGVGQGAHVIASADGTEVYVFEPNGRHLETRNALTSQRLWGFEYDTNGRLSGVRNGHGQLTVIERDPSGSPRAIVGPYGQRTALTVNAEGLLASIERPGSEHYELEYDDGGLLISFEDPTGAASTMAYDEQGRIEIDRDRLGNPLAFSREEQERAWSVKRETPLGFESTFEVEQGYDGGLTRTSELPDGTFVLTERAVEGSSNTTRSDGTTVSSVRGTDPRWGMAAPLFSTTTTLPSGLTQSVQHTRQVALTNPAVPSTLTSQVDTTRINNLNYTDTYTASDRRTVLRTPAGRQTEQWADLFGRTIRSRGPLGPNVHTQFTQDRLTAVIIDPDGTLGNGNERTTSMTYDTLGRLATVKDPRNSVTSFTNYDPADRPHTIVLPDSSAVNMSYDVEGNVSSVTPPGKEPHLMSYGMWGRIESYEPPVGNRVEYFYDADRRMELIDFGPDAGAGEQVVDFAYDPDTSLLDTITSPRGTIDVGYTEGRMTSLVAPSLSGPITTNLAYDGMLPTAVSWSGPVAGQVSWTYNNRFLVASETVGALPATTVTYGYDNDGLVTSAGALTITRDGAGRVLTKTVGRIRETLSYTAYGELARQTVVHLNTNGTVRETLYDAIYVAGTGAGAQGTRDALGRITRKTESIVSTDLPVATARPLQTRRYEYGYNAEGRPWLESVSVDGAVVSSYGYDENGNRTSSELNWSSLGYDASFAQSLSEADTEYNAADQLLTYGDTEYAWNAVGQLQSKRNTTTGDETFYEYDLYGNLLSVVLPDGRSVEYEVDGAGRRVGRRVLSESGTELEYRGWIYRDLLRPIAEVDSLGNVVARYVYDDGAGSKQNGAHQLATRLGANQDTSLPFEGENVPDFIELLSGGTVTTRYRLIKNQVGTVLAVVDATSGEVAQRIEYDEFGRVLFDSTPGLQPFGFAGGLYDAESGLVRFGARDYEPGTGRWTARDPVRFGRAELNGLLYLANNPTDGFDPLGLSKFDKLYGLPKRFWNWYHKGGGGGEKKGEADIGPDAARELCDQWKKDGMPGPDLRDPLRKGEQRLRGRDFVAGAPCWRQHEAARVRRSPYSLP